MYCKNYKEKGESITKLNSPIVLLESVMVSLETLFEESVERFCWKKSLFQNFKRPGEVIITSFLSFFLSFP